MINGSCFYFETTPLNYSDAKVNCRKKLGDDMGRLFEPQSTTPQKTVYEEAIKLAEIDDNDPMWIGISPGNYELIILIDLKNDS